MVAFLLSNGARMDTTASKYCSCCSMQWLVDRTNFGSGMHDSPGRRWIPEFLALYLAICGGHDSTITLLLDRGAPFYMIEPKAREAFGMMGWSHNGGRPSMSKVGRLEDGDDGGDVCTL
jgi:hypothetical protein